jgi:hypothetical protein
VQQRGQQRGRRAGVRRPVLLDLPQERGQVERVVLHQQPADSPIQISPYPSSSAACAVRSTSPGARSCHNPSDTDSLGMSTPPPPVRRRA